MLCRWDVTANYSVGASPGGKGSRLENTKGQEFDPKASSEILKLRQAEWIHCKSTENPRNASRALWAERAAGGSRSGWQELRHLLTVAWEKSKRHDSLVTTPPGWQRVCKCRRCNWVLQVSEDARARAKSRSISRITIIRSILDKGQVAMTASFLEKHTSWAEIHKPTVSKASSLSRSVTSSFSQPPATPNMLSPLHAPAIQTGCGPL